MTPLLEKVELAILANGGAEWDPHGCECEPEVNMAPCRYCAMWDALRSVKQYLEQEKK